MNLIFLAALFLIVFGVIGARGFSESIPQETSNPVALEATTSTPIQTPETQKNELSPTAVPTPAHASTQDNSNSVPRDSDWVYPNSFIVSQGDELILTSNDDTEAITNWYEKRVNSLGYNVRNFVKTSANDNVKNVINALKGETSLSIEITKRPGEGEARIEVVID